MRTVLKVAGERYDYIFNVDHVSCVTQNRAGTTSIYLDGSDEPFQLNDPESVVFDRFREAMRLGSSEFSLDISKPPKE